VIRCRKCNNSASIIPNGMSEEHLRKHFAREGWEIGKTRAGHLCPECQAKSAPKPQPLPKEISGMQAAQVVESAQHGDLLTCWVASQPQDKTEFLMLIASDLEQKEQFISLAQEVFGPQPAPKHCGFCGKYPNQVRWMFASAEAYICEYCVAQIMRHIQQKEQKSEPTGRKSDPTAAERQRRYRARKAEEKLRVSTVEILSEVKETIHHSLDDQPSPVEERREAMPEPVSDDDGPADWWQEIHAKVN
jgi:hypothetical protein